MSVTSGLSVMDKAAVSLMNDKYKVTINTNMITKFTSMQ